MLGTCRVFAIVVGHAAKRRDQHKVWRLYQPVLRPRDCACQRVGISELPASSKVDNKVGIDRCRIHVRRPARVRKTSLPPDVPAGPLVATCEKTPGSATSN